MLEIWNKKFWQLTKNRSISPSTPLMNDCGWGPNALRYHRAHTNRSLSKNPKVHTYNLIFICSNQQPCAIILCVTAEYNTCHWNWSTNKEIDDDDDGNYRIQLGAT